MSTDPTTPTTHEEAVAQLTALATKTLAQFLRDECGYEGEDQDLAWEYAAEAIGWHGGVEHLDPDDNFERPLITIIAASPEFQTWNGGVK